MRDKIDLLDSCVPEFVSPCPLPVSQHVLLRPNKRKHDERDEPSLDPFPTDSDPGAEQCIESPAREEHTADQDEVVNAPAAEVDGDCKMAFAHIFGIGLIARDTMTLRDGDAFNLMVVDSEVGEFAPPSLTTTSGVA